MLRYAVLGMIGLFASNALAQQAPAQVETAARASSASAPPPANAVVTMEEPLPGDHWTYEIRDEISGTIKATRNNIVTEVTPTEISSRVDTSGKADPGQIVFDRSWNILKSGPWKFSPHDGTGIQSPLSPDKTWSFQSNEVNAGSGSSWRRSGKSKVAGKESVTTRAGTFETFIIETSYSARNANDPTKKIEVTSKTWYAPAINHWIKRTFVSRRDGRLMVNSAIELVDYGRKQ
jgi:hypothetical protein